MSEAMLQGTAEEKLLQEVTRDAGQLLMKYFRQELRSQEKGPLDLVTEADLASEALIRRAIENAFPADAIMGEEGGGTGTGDRLWVVDPLDGTVNFAHGIPLFAVAVGFCIHGVPEIGAVFNPASGECFTARRGQGSRLNGLPIPRGARRRAADSLLYVNSHGLRSDDLRAPLLECLARFGTRVQGIANPGSMSLALCSVACGRFDGAVSLGVDHFSTPASSVIMEEAGIRLTDMAGNPFGGESESLLAANRALHDELAEIIMGGL